MTRQGMVDRSKCLAFINLLIKSAVQRKVFYVGFWKATLRALTPYQFPDIRGSGRRFFFCKRGLPSRDISANHMARILRWRRSIINIAQTFTVRVCTCTMYLKYAPYDWLKYRGMAILVCRNKIAGRGGQRGSMCPIFCMKIYHIFALF